MSLFRAKEWWSGGTPLPEDEGHLLNGSLTIVQLGPEGSGDYVVFATPEGVIQIFRPRGSFQPTDVILEYTTKEPIIEISTGKLLSGSNLEHIAVLHPSKVSIYTLTCKEGHTEYGDQNILTQQYYHTFPRAAYCFVIGSFGGVKDKDFICIQTLDGMLMFYEQDLASFNCFLPNVLIPGPLSYSHCLDLFITCTSDWIIEAFSYHNLSHVADSIGDNKNINKKLTPDWTYNIGENILSIQTLQISNHSCCLVMMGEKHLYCLNDNGTLRFMKNLDYDPICLFAYLIGWYYENNARLMVMVVSTASTLYIYEKVTLLWSCQLTFTPLSIRRAFFPSLPGAIVMVTDIGEVKCCYLGTEPELFTAPPLPTSELDFDQAQEELERLQNVIKIESDMSEMNLISKACERELPFSIHINPKLEINDHCPQHECENDEYKFLKCKVEINLKPCDKNNIEYLQVTFAVQPPLICSNVSESMTDISDDILIMTEVYIKELNHISSLNLEVVVLYLNSSGHIRVLKKSEMLPMELVCYPISPLKESKLKLTIAIDKPMIDLMELFKEFNSDKLLELGWSSGVIALRSPNDTNSTVTIISAKSSQRYRLQSNDLSLLNIVLKQLIIRIQNYISTKPYMYEHDDKTVKFSIFGSVSNDIIKYLLNNIEQHALLRQELINAEESLETLSLQFILIIKKLMLKYRERPPAISEGVNFLLQDTHLKITETVSKIMQYKNDIYSYGCRISGGINLMYTIFELLDLNQENLEYFKHATTCNNLNEEFQAWEECCIPNIVHLLRSFYVKNNKEAEKIITFDQNDLVKNYDVKRMIKYIKMLMDKIINNTKGNDSTCTEQDDSTLQLDVLHEEGNLVNDEEDAFKIPEGSMFGHRKAILEAGLDLDLQ